MSQVLSKKTPRLFKDPLEYMVTKFKEHRKAFTGREKRIMPRFEVDVEIVAFANNSSFRTRTLNLSLTGALLKDSLPKDYADHPIEVVVVESRNGKKNRILLKAKAVGGPFRTPRITFVGIGSRETQGLQDIITFGATSMVPL